MPTRPLDVALYVEHLIESDTSSSVLHHASCGISWANKLYGFPDPCPDPLVKNILEAGVRISAKPVVRKEPVTREMMVQSMPRHLLTCLVSELQLYLLLLIVHFYALMSQLSCAVVM